MPISGLQIVTPTSVTATGTGSSASIGALGKTTFSSIETLTLNGVFSSSYENYLVTVRLIGSTANFPVFRLKNSGGEATSGYANQYFYGRSTSGSASRSTSDAYFSTVGNSSTLITGIQFYLYGPQLAERTAVRSVNVDPRSYVTVSDYAGTHTSATSYTDLVLRTHTVPNGTMTGVVIVYGFAK